MYVKCTYLYKIKNENNYKPFYTTTKKKILDFYKVNRIQAILNKLLIH